MHFFFAICCWYNLVCNSRFVEWKASGGTVAKYSRYAYPASSKSNTFTEIVWQHLQQSRRTRPTWWTACQSSVQPWSLNRRDIPSTMSSVFSLRVQVCQYLGWMSWDAPWSPNLRSPNHLDYAGTIWCGVWWVSVVGFAFFVTCYLRCISF